MRIHHKGKKFIFSPYIQKGKGFHNTRKEKHIIKYNLPMPLGLGINYALNEKIMLGAEINFRVLFTDHLDDVSSRYYADTAILRSGYGELSAKMSFRSDETRNPLTFSSDKLLRANPDKKDSYYTAMIKISFFSWRSI
jgi:hypothetical protein